MIWTFANINLNCLLKPAGSLSAAADHSFPNCSRCEASLAVGKHGSAAHTGTQQGAPRWCWEEYLDV